MCTTTTRRLFRVAEKSNPSPRLRVGKVNVDEYHGAWWVER
jgi:hypothetical protein